MYVCVLIDSPGRDPNVISTSSQRSQSAMSGTDTGHKALVLKVLIFACHIYLVISDSFLCLAVRGWAALVACDLQILNV